MESYENPIRVGEWLTIAAVLIGPILAVQAQKMLERIQARRAVKDGIFRTLMTTRASRLSVDHVQALNMIPIAFYGNKVVGFRWQTKVEKGVCRAWRDYLDSLDVDNENFTEDQNDRLHESRFDKLIALVGIVAISQNYDFEPVELRKQMYIPNHFIQVETEASAIRSGMAKILNGNAAFPMEVVSLPRTPGQNE